MKKYRTGIQKQVLNIIEYGCNVMKLPYVTTEELKKELRKPNETDEQIKYRITQAVYHLKKNKKIIDKGYGKYAINKQGKKQYKKCSLLTEKNKRPYCPVKECFIGDPNRQCISIDDTDGTKKTTTPVCPCYTTNKDNLEIAKQKLNNIKAKDIGNYRYYNCNIEDPESKYYTLDSQHPEKYIMNYILG